MKNRIITFLLASTMIISLVGCGDAASAPANEPAATETSSETENETADETSTTVETKSADASDASFEYNGKTVSVLDDLETVKANLGTPTEEQPSPFSDNSSDKLYVFGSDPDTIDLATLDGKVQSISVYDYKIKTTKGIGIGSSEEEVLTAYGNSGEKTESDGETDILYELGKYSIDFYFDRNSKVITIIYENNDAQ
ncbi:hypothetical protein [Butyrivibrio sp. LB2008]|uniref:hypothetical protein n=1 Tax=Butyrivibrio sp. LB2008 TaxID=1408305 RepID=UPI0004792259|nr:hypothetical protein [Butyrivibrio sp. LB2008]